jgi:hypothetical protein
MASQQEVIDYIKSNFNHETIQEFIVKIQVPLDTGRTQMVYAAVTDDELQVTSPVAWQDKVSADEVLAQNGSMFGVVSVNGAYALKHNTFIEDIDKSEIEKAFIVLAFYADELESALGFDDEF